MRIKGQINHLMLRFVVKKEGIKHKIEILKFLIYPNLVLSEGVLDHIMEDNYY